MKASALISKLQEAVSQHGDLEIAMEDGEWAEYCWMPVGDVKLHAKDSNNEGFGDQFLVVHQEFSK